MKLNKEDIVIITIKLLVTFVFVWVISVLISG
jgi:hypothetical protein